MSAGVFVHDIAQGAIFGERDVAHCYAFRPPYAGVLYEKLLLLVANRRRALDLGCGPGKIALNLAAHFTEVTAVDPSDAMIEAGRAAAPDVKNIVWLRETAEGADLDAPYDLVTIGAAIAWMRHDIVFPRFARWLGADGIVAVIGGDDVFSAPWKKSWIAFLARWLARLGSRYDPAGFEASGKSYRPWMEIAGTDDFVLEFEQLLDNFIACQHSRATWARAKMGGALAREFDDDLRATLSPYAKDGLLRFEVQSNLVWGRPRTSRRER